MAELGRAHGIRGEITGRLSGVEPGDLEGRSGLRLRRPDGTEVPAVVRRVRPRPGHAGWIFAIDALPDRNAAEASRGAVLLARRDDLPEPAEDEWYVADLIGCRVETESGESLGELAEVLKLPANDVFVARGERGEVLLPAIDDVLVRVDVAQRRVVVRLLPGLLAEE